MSSPQFDNLKGVFDHLEIEMTFDNVAQFMIFMEALKLYNDRTRSYGQAWQQYGAMSNLLNIARKTDRLMEVWWTKEAEVLADDGRVKPLLHKDNLDDAMDLLNYDAFFIRNARAANIFGEIPQRPEPVN